MHLPLSCSVAGHKRNRPTCDICSQILHARPSCETLNKPCDLPLPLPLVHFRLLCNVCQNLGLLLNSSSIAADDIDTVVRLYLQVRISDQNELSLAATKAEQLVELGTAADFGFCQSHRKVQPHPTTLGKCT